MRKQEASSGGGEGGAKKADCWRRGRVMDDASVPDDRARLLRSVERPRRDVEGGVISLSTVRRQ